MKRIVISGTYCTGKTTLSLALSRASGIPATHALTMREILPELYPGKSLRQCNYTELLTLGMRRFEERIRAERQLSEGFVSDGCTLQEWLYGTTRLLTGAYPDERPWKLRIRQLLHHRAYSDFKMLLKAFGGMAHAYASTHYDCFFHLPVEFPFVSDGHRPTSEQFRKTSEQLLLQTYADLCIHPYIIKGSLSQRLEQVLNILSISPLHPIDEAVSWAVQERRQIFDSVQLEAM